jgi:hypothetical protein
LALLPAWLSRAHWPAPWLLELLELLLLLLLEPLPLPAPPPERLLRAPLRPLPLPLLPLQLPPTRQPRLPQE